MEVANRTQHTGAAYADLVRRQVIEQLGFKGRSESAVETLLGSREKRLEISPNFAALKQSISNANPQSYSVTPIHNPMVLMHGLSQFGAIVLSRQKQLRRTLYYERSNSDRDSTD